jgi:hypothetical protein
VERQTHRFLLVEADGMMTIAKLCTNLLWKSNVSKFWPGLTGWTANKTELLALCHQLLLLVEMMRDGRVCE